MGTIVLLAPEVIPLQGSEWVETQRLFDSLVLQGFAVQWVKTPPELIAYLPWVYPDVVAYWLYFPPVNVAEISSDGLAASMESRWAPLQWIRQQDTNHLRPVFVLSGQYAESDHVSALQHGADRYFLASASMTVLLAAVQAHQRTVTSGLFSGATVRGGSDGFSSSGFMAAPRPSVESVSRSPFEVPPTIASPSVSGNSASYSSMQAANYSAPANERSLVSLTPREQEIVVHLARGASNSAIAQALSISPTTVKNHLAHVYKKLGVTNRTEAAYRAQKLQWLE
jgi:DNA-binding NarL/FixJ family response regulator